MFVTMGCDTLFNHLLLPLLLKLLLLLLLLL
jgi:hypothetical protein